MSSQLETVAIVTRTFSVVGFTGVCLMMFMMIRYPNSFNNPTGRVIMAITVTDLFDSVTKFIGRWGPESGIDSFLCRFQVWSITQFNLSSIILGLTLGLNAMYIIYFRGTLETIQKYELFMIAFAFIAPLPLSLSPFFLRVNDKILFGDVTLWCWINQSTYQVYFWFMILWTVFIVNVFILFFTVKGIRKAERELLMSGEKMTKEQKKQHKKKSFGTFVTKRMVAYIVAFFITWTASSTNRVYQLANGQSLFVLTIAQSIFSPSRGMINFLAYFYTWYSKLTRWNNPSHERTSSRKDSNFNASAEVLGKASLKGSSAASLPNNSTSTVNLPRVRRGSDNVLKKSAPDMSEDDEF